MIIVRHNDDMVEFTVTVTVMVMVGVRVIHNCVIAVSYINVVVLGE